MKFTTTTTSSLLLATMAMSPSLSVAAPTGMELPTSPNPAGTPSIRQFASSPLFDGSVRPSPRKNHAPALRTGPGSPRRSIPSRMLRVYKRQDAQSSDPLAGVVDPLVSTTGSLLHTIYGTLDGLPIIGKILKNVLPVVPDAHAQAASAASAPISVASHASDSISNSGLKLPIDPSHLLGELPSSSKTLGGLGLDALPGTIRGPRGTINGLPVASTLEGSLPSLAGLPSPIGLGILPSGSNPSIPHIPLEPQTPHSQQPDNIIQLPNGGLLVDIDGVWKEFPGSHLPAFSDVLAVEPDHPSSATGSRPPVAGNGKSAPQVPGLSVHPPSPPASHIPVHPLQPGVSSPHAPQAAAAEATPPESKLPIRPATPTGTSSHNTPAHPNPPAASAVGAAPTAAASSQAGGIPPAGPHSSIQAAEFQPESSVHDPASSSTVNPVSHTAPNGAETSVAAASLADPADVDHVPSNPAPGLIHGMSAP